MHCNENPIYVFLFWGLRGLSPNFHIHVSVGDLYIPRSGPHFSCSRIGRMDCGNIQIAHRQRNVEIGTVGYRRIGLGRTFLVVGFWFLLILILKFQGTVTHADSQAIGNKILTVSALKLPFKNSRSELKNQKPTYSGPCPYFGLSYGTLSGWAYLAGHFN